MPSGGLIAAGTAGIVGSTAGGIVASGKQANAAQGIASNQAAAAALNRQQALGYAAPTAFELSNMNQQLQAAGTALQRQAAVFASIDPSVMQASQQSLKLMQGQNAATIQPMLAQRAVQRTQLLQQLQTQLGPAGASSSAGQQALQNFDMQTNTMQAQLQQSALGSLGNFMQSGAAAEQSGILSGNQATSLFGQVGTQAGNIQTRLANASIGTSLTPYAGAPFAGAASSANSAQGMYNQLGGISGKVLGAGLTPQQPTTPGTTDTGVPSQNPFSNYSLGTDTTTMGNTAQTSYGNNYPGMTA